MTSEECIFKVLSNLLIKQCSIPYNYLFHFLFSDIYNNDKSTQELMDNWEKILPLTFYYDHLSESDISEINHEIYNYYHKNGLIIENNVNVTKV